MSYLDQHLMTGEQVVYRSKLHWTALRWGILFTVLFVFSLMTGDSSATGLFFLLAAVFGLGGLVSMKTSEFGVTNKRVIIKVGLLRTRSLETLLTKVEGIGVEQSLLGRILGYGTIVINGTGGTREPFARIASPLDFRRQVQEQIAALPGGGLR